LPKNTKPKLTREKLGKAPLNEKRVRKMLMKLTPDRRKEAKFTPPRDRIID